jgi:MinD-like ATPase involved in chromosome partitioning or flagellar assembly
MVYRQISEVARRFLNVIVYEAGVLLRDERLIHAVRQRKPVVLAYPQSQISCSIATLAARLCESGATNCCQEGFFRKVVSWFS